VQVMTKFISILILLFLAGCATQPKIVYVPTPVRCPTPKIPREPNYLPITQTMIDTNYVKAITVNYKMCRDNNKQLRKGYAAYEHK
jgi:PBP1b-binding outer membrane lipoprotein LpoB